MQGESASVRDLQFRTFCEFPPVRDIEQLVAPFWNPLEVRIWCVLRKNVQKYLALKKNFGVNIFGAFLKNFVSLLESGYLSFLFFSERIHFSAI